MLPGRIGRLLQISRSHGFSMLALIAGNVMPLINVLFLGANTYDLIYFFWLEGAVIGGLSVVRLLSMIRRDVSVLSVPLAVAVFVPLYGAILWLCLYLILSMPVIVELVADGTNNLSSLPSTSDPLGMIKSSYRTGTIGCVIGFLLGQGYAFYDRYHHSTGFRNARAMAVIGHACQRVMIILVVCGIGFWTVFVTLNPVHLIALMVVLKTLYDLWENSAAFDPLNMPGSYYRV